MDRKKDTNNSGFGEATIVSFDIPHQDSSKRLRIHRLLCGRTQTQVVNGEKKTYEYPGLLDEGGFRLGQSVFLLPPDLASRLILKLRELRISHRYWEVFVQG